MWNDPFIVPPFYRNKFNHHFSADWASLDSGPGMHQQQTDKHADGKNTKRAVLIVFIVMATALVVRGDVTYHSETASTTVQTDQTP